ncbi:ABC transporter permease [Bosea sp. Root381]|uniref:ABC transporter permease n=1 Tax=Bosea sp. Root381 TaxID=1736524 RepID=UPI0009E69F14|nr:ABC transporter permease [Bosea sp. Root381]
MQNWVLPALTAIAVAAACGLGFLSHAPNRIVPGRPLPLHAVAGTAMLWVLAILAAGLLVLAFRRPGQRTTLLTGSALLAALILILAAAGTGAAALANPEVPAARTSLGPAFWLILAALALAFIDLAQQAGLSTRARLLLAIAILAPVVGMAALGWFDALSLAREYRARSDVFAAALRQHVFLVASTALVAVSLGVPLGIRATRRPRFRRRLFAVLNIVQTVPSIALFGLMIGPLSSLAEAVPGLKAVGVSGIGTTPALIALICYALLPLVRNTVTGLDAVPAATIDAAQGLGMRRNQILLQVSLPLALPVILAGLRIVIVQTIGLAVVAALIGAGGLGAFVFQGLGQNALDLVLLGVIPTILLALATDAAFSALAANGEPKR